MNDAALSRGDLVRLRSGGPVMTIKDIAAFGMGGGEEEALCVWFEGKKLSEQRFALYTLEKVEQGSGIKASFA